MKAPGISPTSLSLNEAARFQGLKPWLGVEGVDSWPSWKPAWLTCLTFLLLRPNSSCYSLERERERSMLTSFVKEKTMDHKFTKLIHNLILLCCRVLIMGYR